jgi:excisionase family DNA binding protein
MRVVTGIKIYSVKEVAKMLQVTPVSVRTYAHKGKLSFQTIGGKMMITEESIKSFLQGKTAEEEQ